MGPRNIENYLKVSADEICCWEIRQQQLHRVFSNDIISVSFSVSTLSFAFIGSNISWFFAYQLGSQCMSVVDGVSLNTWNAYIKDASSRWNVEYLSKPFLKHISRFTQYRFRTSGSYSLDTGWTTGGWYQVCCKRTAGLCREDESG